MTPLTTLVLCCSLEKQRSGRLEFVVGVPSPAGSDSELEIMGRVADLQEKFTQHR